MAAIESIKPTTIIGVSTVGGTFTQEVIEAMSQINERPVVLALSNPTEHAECTPEQAYTWSKGKAIYAAGVQFPPVHLSGQAFLPGQAINFYIFPAVGMAIFATQATATFLVPQSLRSDGVRARMPVRLPERNGGPGWT